MKRLVAGVLVCAIQLAGCETTTQSGAVGADRQQLLLISSSELENVAAKTYTQLTQQAAGQTHAESRRRSDGARADDRQSPHSADQGVPP